MPADVVIRAERLGKKYVIGHQAGRERYVALRDVVGRTVRNFARTAGDMMRGRPIVVGETTEEFWALKHLDFELRRGEVLGIIGRNGAGKSTLLKILSRITEPTQGRVEIHGRVASLLEVGTGFHPELTGRENIFLNGAILGMTRAEIRRKFDEIVAFAEVEQFLDTPVKRYSSGMYVRLAFALAAHLDPEILIIDEVLAVGDAEFQKKSLGKMSEVASGGRTVLFVSHNLPMIRTLCSRVILLSGGRVVLDGAAEQAILQHHKDAAAAVEETPLAERRDRNGNGRLRFTNASVFGRAGVHNLVNMGDDVDIVLGFTASAPMMAVNVSILLQNAHDEVALRLSTYEMSKPFQTLAGTGVIRCSLRGLALLPGRYHLLLAASVPPSFEYLDYIGSACFFDVVEADVYGTGRIPESGVFFAFATWSKTKHEPRHNESHPA